SDARADQGAPQRRAPAGTPAAPGVAASSPGRGHTPAPGAAPARGTGDLVWAPRGRAVDAPQAARRRARAAARPPRRHASLRGSAERPWRGGAVMIHPTAIIDYEPMRGYTARDPGAWPAARI